MFFSELAVEAEAEEQRLRRPGVRQDPAENTPAEVEPRPHVGCGGRRAVVRRAGLQAAAGDLLGVARRGQRRQTVEEARRRQRHFAGD